LRRDVLEPLMRDESGRRRARAEKAAATKVEFFTLVRGEDR
jgi:alpha-D-ribose 1-methylphosphonate 5-triphosphate synthase subunit PhnG